MRGKLGGYLAAVGAGALCFLGLAALSSAAYLDDPTIFSWVLGGWCLGGLFLNRWMLSPLHRERQNKLRLWIWYLLGCWAWPVGAVCGLAIRLAPLEKTK